MSNRIDLNCDIGEGFGVYRMADDDAMLDLVSSVNVACGFHAGDADIMASLVTKTLKRGIALGAHPGFRDLHGFGRREIKGIPPRELRNLIIYQVGALQALARAGGYRVTHMRTHGALANMSESDVAMGRIVAEACHDIDPRLMLMTRPDCTVDRAGRTLGLSIVRQAFADRAYNDDGTLVSRRQPGAVIHNPDFAAERMLQLAEKGTLQSINGKTLRMEIDTICVHGDTPAAVQMAEAVRGKLENNGFRILAYNKSTDVA